MGVSFDELRQVCQKPVAAGNDVAGLLFGDRLSLPLTKLFVDRGWSPNIATVGMLVCGLLGAVLQLLGPWPALIGAAVLLLYYVLDFGVVTTFNRSVPGSVEPLWYRLSFPYLHPFKGFCLSASIFMVVAISAERHRAICSPLTHRPTFWPYVVMVFCVSGKKRNSK